MKTIRLKYQSDTGIQIEKRMDALELLFDFPEKKTLEASVGSLDEYADYKELIEYIEWLENQIPE